jgi:hypothetical protein
VLLRLLDLRLENLLVHELRELSSITFGISDFSLGSMLTLYGPLAKGALPARIEGTVWRDIRGLSSDELAELLPEARAAAVLAEVRSLRNPLAIADRHLWALEHLGRPYVLSERLTALRAVKVEDLVRACTRLASAKNVVATLQRPPEGTRPVPGGRLVEGP